MRLQLLGPVRAWDGDRPIDLGVRQQRFALAVLALQVNTLVPVHRLVDLMWPEAPPRSARGIIHTHISRLRTILGRAGAGGMAVLTEPEGYRLRGDPMEIDAYRFQDLLARVRAGRDPGEQVALLDQALALWDGPALAGTTSEEIRLRLCHHLEQARLGAVEDRADALLRLGRHHEVIGELTALSAEHPHRQRVTALLMLALHRAGRTAEALRAYQHSRRALADDLGLDPGDELQRLHQAILRADEDLVGAVPAGASPPVAMPRPAQLPADLPAFTGRKTELDRLLALLPAEGHPMPAASVMISAIDGMAGVGKTALAVHAAHRMAARFPDGQLFIDLRGFSPQAAPVDPSDALDRMLRALGIPGERIPQELDDRAALLRSTLATRRILMVLDNAATEAQVQPLLPGTPGCLVLITSRRLLTGLDDTLSLSLDLLPTDDAVALFVRSVGEERLLGTPPELLIEIVERCGRLPLAIRIAAARLRSRPAWTAAHLAERLRDHDRRLSELEAAPRSVTAAIDLSVDHLAPDERRLYRLLGLHPGADIDRYAAAALAGTTVARAEPLLDGLTDIHLVDEPAPGRHQLHDLVRAHAAGAVAGEETEAGRAAALARLFDYYVHAASVATAALYPYDAGGRSSPATPATPAPALNDEAQAAAWLDAELANLLAVAGYAAAHGWPAHTVALSSTLHRHLRGRAYTSQARTLHAGALTAARAAGDRAGELDALIGLGRVHYRQGRTALAAEHLGRALAIARDIGHGVGELHALTGLGYVDLRAAPDTAAEDFRQALRVARTIGHRVGELEAVIGLADVHYDQGRYQPASEHYQSALDIARDLGHRVGEMTVLRGLGNVHHAQGQHQQAADCFERCLRVARDLGHRVGELHALRGLGNVCHAQGRHRDAAGHYQWAMDIARETGDPNGRFEAVHGLGRVHRATGHADRAAACHREALDLARELDQPADAARALDGLAWALADLGRPEQAREYWRQALGILTEINLPQTEEQQVGTATIRDNLARLDQPAGQR